jgi:hypothetical protein
MIYQSVHANAGQLTNHVDILRFITAGNATLTLVSKQSGNRFTFKFQRPDSDAPNRPIWVRVLNGPDNENSYEFVGTIWIQSNGSYMLVRGKSTIQEDATSVKILNWFIRAINNGRVLEQAEVWHEGRCGRCGRKLTVPESISSGYGPECIKLMNS